MIGLIIHLTITIGAIWYFTRPYREEGSALSKGFRKDVPLDILKQRFAKGDISEEDYRTAREALDDQH